MAIKVRTKRMVLVAIAFLICLITGGIGFVTHFMHDVYETEAPLGELEVPKVVRENFAKLFPAVTDVAWEFEEDLYEAEFTENGQANVEAHFTPNGIWAKTVRPIQFAELPEKAQAYLKAQDGYKIIEEEQIDLPGARRLYEAKLANKLQEWVCQFDSSGSLVSRTRDGPVLE